MITTNGETHVLRFFAGIAGTIGSQIVLGTGTKAEAKSDFRLDFEAIRVDVSAIGIDADNKRIIFKGIIPSEVTGTFYESGLISEPPTTSPEEAGRILADFNEAELWTGGEFQTTGRSGGNSYRLDAVASGNSTALFGDVAFDLSKYSDSDEFNIAFTNNSANTSSVVVRVGSDSSNYLSYKIDNPAQGYVVASWKKSEMSQTGSPDLTNATYLAVVLNAKVGGAAQVDVDGLRIEDADTLDTQSVLVARKVLESPVTKTAGVELEIEYSLGLTIV